MSFVAIEGVIGVGKTTLARYLHERMGGSVVLEVFEENPFLSAFYADRDRYAFQTQMFFLLSRYRQMQQLAEAPEPILSDYMFAKDQLFARQNIRGDEWMIYERVYAALSENVVQPDLVVYLRADTPTLMQRIAIRDRPYERDMDEGYIDMLRVAYENFFNNYPSARVLTIDTTHLDVVHDTEQRQSVLGRIQSRMGDVPLQPALPGLDTNGARADAHHRPLEADVPPRKLPELSDVLLQTTYLQEHSADLARLLREGWARGAVNAQPMQKTLIALYRHLDELAAMQGFSPQSLAEHARQDSPGA